MRSPFFILFFLTSLLLNGQNKDSLLTVLSKPVIDSSAYADNLLISSKLWFRHNRKISDSLLQLAHNYITHKSPEDILSLRTRIMLAKRLPNKGERKRNNLLRLEEIAQNTTLDLEYIFDLKLALARILFTKKDYQASIDKYLEIMQLAKDNPDLKVHAMMGIANPLIYQEDYYTAMDYLQQALKIPGNHHYKVYLALPNICRKTEEWDKMIDYANIGLKYSTEKKNKNEEVFALMQLGYAMYEKGKPDSAIYFANKAWQIKKERKYYQRAGVILGTIIKANNELGNYKEALAIEDEIKKLPIRIGSPEPFYHLGNTYLLKQDYQNSILQCRKALFKLSNKHEQEYDVQLHKKEIYECLYKSFEASNNIDSAFFYQKLYVAAKNEVDNKDKFKAISKAMNLQELAQQETVLLMEKEQSDQLYKEKLTRLKTTGVLGILVIGIGTLMLILLRKRNKKINAQNQVIEKALLEKDLLLREIHHRVKNNLQLISSLLTLQGRDIDDKTAKEAIAEGNSRVRSMALIHHDLYHKENLTEISVKNYLEKLIDELISTYHIEQNRIDVNMDIDNIELDVDTLVPLGLIINELITNTLKYAFPDGKQGKINIQLEEESDHYMLEIADDGIGYNVVSQESSSFGTTLIKSLTNQLEADLKINTQNGTTTTLSIPK